jgi:hypothetical protein
MLTFDDIVGLFGSPRALAEALTAERQGRAVSRESVYVWKGRGVPESCHAALIEACRKKGLHLTIAEIVQMQDRAAASSGKAA